MRLAASLAALALMAVSLVGAERDSGPARRLHQFLEAEWDWEMAEHPTRASALGDRRFNDRWPDVSLANLQAQQTHRVKSLERLKAIPRDRLTRADQLNHDLYRYRLERQIEGFPFQWHLIRTATYDGLQTIDRLVESLRFETTRDYEDWLARLSGFPPYVDQNIELMRAGIAANILLPKVVVRRVLTRVTDLAASGPDQAAFFKPFRRFPATVPEADQRRLAAAGRLAVTSAVQPAWARLRDFLEREYLPAAYDSVGIWQIARGPEAYAHFARVHTTTTLTPRAIHEIGLAEVARIRARMEAVRSEVGFQGTLAEFFRHLRTDPRFFYRTGDELLAAYRALAKRIDPELVKVVRTLPRLPYGVAPVPESIAPEMTTAYASPGAADGSRAAFFYVNLYRPETRARWEMLALTLHEAAPGHCLQSAVAIELEGLPKFRRHGGITAYVEGWGLYAEALGDDMGMYTDPYDRFGQLTYEMWRAVRLVVDTGLHVLRWDRDRAIAYFMEQTAKSELDVTNEVDRYISWPGQALAYKIGELKLKELRADVVRQLGSGFDLRDFHDAVLRAGPLPLEVLEAEVQRWVRGRAGRRPS